MSSASSLMRSSVLQLGGTVSKEPSTSRYLSAPLHTTVPPALMLLQPHEHTRCCQGHCPPSYTET